MPYIWKLGAGIPTRWARGPGEALHPSYWNGHLATLAPQLFGGWGQKCPVIGRGQGPDQITVSGTLSRVFSPLGLAFSKTDGAAGSRLGWAFAALGTPVKIDPPFTLSCVARWSAQAAGVFAFLFATDVRSAIDNYYGTTIYATDDGTLEISQNYNANQSIQGSRYVHSYNAYLLNDGLWHHVIVRVSPIVQGDDVDSTYNTYVRFFVDGQEEPGHLTVGSASSSVHHLSRDSTVGYQRGDISYTGGNVDFAPWSLWNRMLSDAEITGLFADPYVTFRMPRRVYGLPVAATGRVVSLGGYYKSATRAVLVG